MREAARAKKAEEKELERVARERRREAEKGERERKKQEALELKRYPIDDTQLQQELLAKGEKPMGRWQTSIEGRISP